MKANGLKLIIFGFLTAFLGCAVPADANDPPIYTQKWLDDRYDWVLFVDLSTLKNYLQYPGTNVGPILDAKISYHVNPRLAPNHENTVMPYEDLWFHREQTVGLKRFRTLPFKTGWQGAICISPGTDTDENTSAATNTVIHLLVDVAVKSCVTTATLAPRNNIPSIKSDLARFNFLETKDSSLSDVTITHLLLSSGNPDDSVFLNYKPPR
jgi:hypothetical protein